MDLKVIDSFSPGPGFAPVEAVTDGFSFWVRHEGFPVRDGVFDSSRDALDEAESYANELADSRPAA